MKTAGLRPDHACHRPGGQTPTWGSDPDAERWQRLQTFAVAHPELESGRTVARYLDLLRAQEFQRTREVARFLETVRGDPGDWRLRSY